VGGVAMSLRSQLRRASTRAMRAWGRVAGGPSRPPEPPDCPANQRIGPPDFVGIGAQKAGTSWWNALLEAHPDVHRHPDRPKELHYFDGLWERAWSASDATRYARYFPRPGGAVAGEWTPSYMVDFWTPGLIARAAPGARILVLLRDPVDRFQSGLTHTDDASGTALTHQDATGAFQRGLYGQQLRRVLDAVPHDQVLLLQYEACRADPAGQLARTFAFLGLRPVQLPPATFGREVNATTADKAELSADLRAALLEAYAVDLEGLKALAPELDLARWPTAVAAGLA
jgi:hypothetical protein